MIQEGERPFHGSWRLRRLGGCERIDLSKLLTLVIAGAVSGALYSLIAAGLVVSYTATGIFNLGYGAVAFTSAFLYFELHRGLGWPIAWAAIVTIGGFAPLLGLGLDKL